MFKNLETAFYKSGLIDFLMVFLTSMVDYLMAIQNVPLACETTYKCRIQ
jgi:hypothetical protein